MGDRLRAGLCAHQNFSWVKQDYKLKSHVSTLMQKDHIYYTYVAYIMHANDPEVHVRVQWIMGTPN